MKILKTIGIALLAIVVLLLVVSIFLPSKIHVERSTIIQAPLATVFNTVNNLHSWEHWSYWDRIDPKMESRFEGPESGAGSIHFWSSTNDSVGTGNLKIAESTPHSHIATELSFENWGTTFGGWKFEETAEGTKATIYMDPDMGFTGRIMPGLFMNDWLGKDFDKTLAGLKNYTENLPAEKPSFHVEKVTTTAADVMSMRVTCSQAEMPAKMGEIYGQLQAAIAKQSLQIAGPAYTLYHKWAPPDTIEMEPGFVVNKAGKNDGHVVAGKMQPVQAARLDYYGDYSRLGDAHMYMDEWLKANNLSVAGAPWEEYLTSPQQEPDTSKWFTRIYYPVN
jgi:effector-binding domain-containing protein